MNTPEAFANFKLTQYPKDLLLRMSELCVKIPRLVYERDLLSNDNRLFDLLKTQVYCGSPSVPSANALLRPDRPAGIH